MEIERLERERFYRIFCERHRPLKIVKEQEEKDTLAVEEVYKFAKMLEKCIEINQRVEAKIYNLKKITPFNKTPKVQSLGLNLNGQTTKYRIIGDIKTLKQDKLNLYKEKELAKLRLLEEKKQ